MNLWHKISNIGIQNSLSEADVRRARLTNRLLFIGFCLSLTYIPVFIKQNSMPLLINVCTLIVALGSLFFLVRKSQHNLAAILLCFFLITHMILSGVMIQGGTGRYFLFLFSIIGFAIVQQQRIGILIFVYAVSGFFLSEYIHLWVEPIITRTSDSNHAVYVLNMLIIFMGGFFLIFHYKRGNAVYEADIIAQKGQIEKQHDQLTETHKEIKDSIRYAKRIQAAILPQQKELDAQLNDYFVLYEPKDIVAGDFYWLEKKDNKVFFAVADCTGHGVPGAMVSVICNNALNRSVRELNLSDPGKILDACRNIVVQEFEKSDEEVRDGMDITLITIEGNNLQFAGANNSLWILRNNEHITLRADKQPIGKFEINLPYSTKDFELQKGDVLYLFSDGYADQFGGEKGKKLKLKALLELFLAINQRPMKDQKEELLQFFNDWRTGYEQVDDVCVVGVRI